MVDGNNAPAANGELPETIALRFRDFGVDTVTEHNAIAAEAGHVWWGWWKKPAEMTPRRVLQGLEERIEGAGEPLEIFLVDSGHDRLFKAKLDKIAVAPDLQENQGMTPPEPQLVPEYYRGRSWRVWFRFSEQIAEVDTNEINAYSYKEVPATEFVEDPHLEAFDNKVVFSVREMLGRRHRTIYFLRRRRQDDREALVELEAPDQPRAFSTAPQSSDSTYVLVLSDLHMSDDRAEHGYPQTPIAGDPSLLDLLERDRTEYFHDEPPAAIVVAGDLTWAGTDGQFDQAREFLSQLRSIWGLDWLQIVAVPGNHDIKWTRDDGGVQPAPPEAEAAYRRFVTDTFGYSPEDQLSMGRRYLLGNFVPLDIVALSSVRFESEGFRGYGYVGSDQLLNAFNEMGWSEADSEPEPRVRMLVLHHHVVPVRPVESIGAERYSLTLDAGELLYSALERRVDLIVHGHQHKPFAAAFSRMGGNTAPVVGQRILAVHGAGSVGVATSHLPQGETNSYSVLRFAPDSMRLEVRTRSSQHGHAFAKGWEADFDRRANGYFAKGVLEA